MKRIYDTITNERNIKIGDWVFKAIVIAILTFATTQVSGHMEKVDNMANNLIKLTTIVDSYINTAVLRMDQEDSDIKYLERLHQLSQKGIIIPIPQDRIERVAP